MRQEICTGKIGGRTERKIVASFVKTCEDLLRILDFEPVRATMKSLCEAA
jgi:hypothetical protein